MRNLSQLIKRDQRGPHLLGGFPLNPAALLLAPVWGMYHGTLVGVWVPVPLMAWGVLGTVLVEKYPPATHAVTRPALALLFYWLPAILFAWHADDLAWTANPTRWDVDEYRGLQLAWLLLAALLLPIGWLLLSI
jgi:hypothetical protein